MKKFILSVFISVLVATSLNAMQIIRFSRNDSGNLKSLNDRAEIIESCKCLGSRWDASMVKKEGILFWYMDDGTILDYDVYDEPIILYDVDNNCFVDIAFDILAVANFIEVINLDPVDSLSNYDEIRGMFRYYKCDFDKNYFFCVIIRFENENR